MSRSTVSLKLRGRMVEVEYTPVAAEPDVGIMSDGFDDEALTDEETGEKLAWELETHELQAIANAVCENDHDDCGDQW